MADASGVMCELCFLPLCFDLPVAALIAVLADTHRLAATRLSSGWCSPALCVYNRDAVSQRAQPARRAWYLFLERERGAWCGLACLFPAAAADALQAPSGRLVRRSAAAVIVALRAALNATATQQHQCTQQQKKRLPHPCAPRYPGHGRPLQGAARARSAVPRRHRRASAAAPRVGGTTAPGGPLCQRPRLRPTTCPRTR